MGDEVKKPDTLSIVDKAFEEPGSEKSYKMRKADYQLNCLILETYIQGFRDESQKDNREFKEKLISDAIDVIKYELRPISESVAEIEKKIGLLCDDVGCLKSVQKRHGLKIRALEKKTGILEKLLKELKKIQT